MGSRGEAQRRRDARCWGEWRTEARKTSHFRVSEEAGKNWLQEEKEK